MSFLLRQRANGIWIGEFSLFASEKIVHGISTRLGGVSIAPYDTMNLALHMGDKEEDVIENRRRFFEALDISLQRMCTSMQVHGTKIQLVEEKDAGKGAFSQEDALEGIDALVTRAKNIPLMLCFADCVPLLFFDPVQNVVAVSHAGWRGTLGRIGQKTLSFMEENCGTKAEDCLVGIAPAITADDYEVSREMVEDFLSIFPRAWEKEYIVQDGKGKLFLDLPKLNFLQCMECGVKKEHIDYADVSTARNTSLFFSYRKSQQNTGRMGVMITLIA